MSAEHFAILIVDGDEDEAALLRGYLEEGLGASVSRLESTPTGAGATERLAAGGWDLVLVDQRLADGDGVDFLRRLGDSLPRVPAIFLCGTASGEVPIEARTAGAYEALVKRQLTPAALATAIRYVSAVRVRDGARLAAEEALRRSEAWLRTLMEASLDLVAIVDQEARLRFVTPSVSRILGRDPSEVIGHGAMDLVHPVDLALARDGLARVSSRAGPSRPLLLRFLHKDGTFRSLEVLADSRLDDPSIQGVIVSCRDVTDRETAHAQARASREELTGLFEASPVPMLLLEQGGRILALNGAFLATFGWSVADVPTIEALEERVYPDPAYRAERAAKRRENYARASPGGLFTTPLLVWRRRDGHDRTVEISGSVVASRLLAVVRDVTDEAAVLEELRASRERLALVLEGGQQGSWNVDLTTSEIRRDEAWAERAGIAPRGTSTSEQLEWIHPDDREAANRLFFGHIKGNEPEFSCEYRVRARDGGWRWIRDRGRIVKRSPDGSPLVFAGVEWDDTERREAQEALKRRDALLEATTIAAERLLGKASWRDVLPEVLASLGRAAGAGRAHLFRLLRDSQGSLSASIVGQWCAPGVREGLGDASLTCFPFPPPGFEPWLDRLLAGEPFIPRFEALPAPAREFLRLWDVRATIDVPVPGEAEPWGFLGLDDCAQERVWSGAEVGELEAAARILGAAMAREQTAEALVASETRHNRLLEALPVAAVVHRDGRFLWANPAALRIFGVTRLEDVVGTLVLDRVHPDDRPRVLERVSALGNRGSAVPLLEERLLRMDGSVVVAEVMGQAVNLPDGPAVELVVIDATARREAEAAIRRGEERLRLVLEAVSEGFWDWDLVTGAITCSPGWWSALGYGLDEVPTQRRACDGLVHPDDAGRARELLEEHLQGRSESYSTELRLRRKDGTWCDVLDRGRVVERTAEGLPRRVVGALKDISDRKTAQAAMEKSELFHRRLVEEAFDVQAILAPDGRLTYQSPGTEALVGMAPGDLVEKNVFEFIHEGDAARIREVMAECFSAPGNQARAEYRFRHADGRWVWIESTARNLSDDPVVGGVVVNSREITDRRLATDEARRLKIAIEHSTDVVLMTDPNGAILYVNPAFETLYGWRREEALGKTPRILKSGRLPASYYAEMWATLLAGRAFTGKEIPNRTRDGRLVTVDVSIDPVPDPHGGIGGYIAVQRDVTQARLAADQLQRAERMEAVGRLSSGLAHDFNNVLNVITGYAEMALARSSEGDPLVRPLREIQKAAAKAAALTKQLTAFGGRRRQSPVPIDLNVVVSRANGLLRPLVGESLSLAVELSQDPVRVYADPGDLEQVLVNLVVNARDAVGGKGSVTVSTGTFPVPPGSETEATGLAPGTWAVLSVSDDGPGIEPEVLSRVFEPFFSTKGSGKGTGLGLATVDAVARRAGGVVRVESAPGLGTTFRVLLPLAPPPVVAAPRPPESSGNSVSLAGPRGDETILVVEDEPQVLEVLRISLEEAGYTVLSATGLEEAVAVAAAHRATLGLLVADIVLRTGSGPEAAARIQEAVPGTSVLFISGWAGALERLGTVPAGADFLQKPFSQADLRHRVRRALDTRAGVR